MSAYRSHTRILVEPYRADPEPYRAPSPPQEPPWPTLEERGIYDYAKAGQRGQRHATLSFIVGACLVIGLFVTHLARVWEQLLRAFP